MCANVLEGREGRKICKWQKTVWKGNRDTRQIGTAYEQLAADYLKAQGYEILEHNFRCGLGEIDRSPGNYLVYLEVKYHSRSDCGYQLRCCKLQKQVRISMAQRIICGKITTAIQIQVRFDVVSIQGRNGFSCIKMRFLLWTVFLNRKCRNRWMLWCMHSGYTVLLTRQQQL